MSEILIDLPALQQEIAMLRDKIKELEKLCADLIIQATCAGEKGAREMAEMMSMIGVAGHHLSSRGVEQIMQLWREGRK